MRSVLDFAGAPPPPPPFKSQDPPNSGSHSLLIITAVIVLVIVVSGAIHCLLRFLAAGDDPDRRRISASSSPPPLTPPATYRDPIDSLPLFSLASSLAAFPKSSPDCAVCLASFNPHDELRLLPACRHAFHAACIDTWLRATPSCPLCRASISLPFPPILDLPPPLEAAGSGSFRIEIGSVSRRISPPEGDTVPVPPINRRSYSLGSSFEFVVEEEVEAILDRMRRRSPPEKEEKAEESGGAPANLAAAAGGGSRGWLREYVDRMTSSASSSFSSLRCSGRWSQRFDDGGGVAGRDSWDFESEESGIFSNFSRWLWGPQ